MDRTIQDDYDGDWWFDRTKNRAGKSRKLVTKVTRWEREFPDRKRRRTVEDRGQAARSDPSENE